MTTTFDGITLPDSLQWTDELTAQSVSQTMRRALDGSIVVYHGAKKNGLTINLESKSDTGWVRREVVTQLKERADQSGGVFNLTLRDTTFNVMFDHTKGSALEATPVMPWAAPKGTDYYQIKLKLLTL